MENNELNTLFNDFKKQVLDITDHSDKVQKLNFNCTLLNGTGFKFNYDVNKYNKEPKKYKPATTFNGIVDILSAVLSIVFLVLYSIDKLNFNFISSNITNILIIILFSFLITFFILRAIYHLFHATSIVRNPLFRLSEALKLVILLNLNILISVIYNINSINIVIFISFILCALALLCMGIGTKLSFKIEMFFSATLPFLMLISSTEFSIIFSSIILCISSLIYIIMNNNEAKTNSIFMILGISLLVLNLFIIV